MRRKCVQNQADMIEKRFYIKFLQVQKINCDHHLLTTPKFKIMDKNFSLIHASKVNFPTWATLTIIPCRFRRNLHGSSPPTSNRLLCRAFGECHQRCHRRAANPSWTRTESVHHGRALSSSCDPKGQTRCNAWVDGHFKVGNNLAEHRIAQWPNLPDLVHDNFLQLHDIIFAFVFIPRSCLASLAVEQLSDTLITMRWFS